MTNPPGQEKRAAQRALEALIDDKTFLGAAIDGFAKAYTLDSTERDLLLVHLQTDKMVSEISTTMLNGFLKASMTAALHKTML